MGEGATDLACADQCNLLARHDDGDSLLRTPGCGRLRVLTRSILPFKSTKGDDRKGGN
jgi:hypothetical protein